MGNNRSKPSSSEARAPRHKKKSKPKPIAYEEIESVTPLLTYNEWLAKIREQRTLQDEKLDTIDDQDYQLFIDYLIFKRLITGYSDVCIVARIVRHYVGSTVHGAQVFADNAIEFDGIRIAVAIHPITAHIYIADESRVFHFTDSSFETVAKVPDEHRAQHRITDVTFSADGERMFCILNNDTRTVYPISINDDAMSVEQRIIGIEYSANDADVQSMHDTTLQAFAMDYLLFDFNHFYLNINDNYLPRLMQQEDIAYFRLMQQEDIAYFSPLKTLTSPSMYKQSMLYTLDSYRQILWMVCGHASWNVHLSGQRRYPVLLRIPFEFVILTRKLNALGLQGKHGKHTEKEKQKLSEQRTLPKNQCAVISLAPLLKHDLYVNAKKRHHNNRINMPEILAFDVDKLHGGVYIVTGEKLFFRIEKSNQNVAAADSELKSDDKEENNSGENEADKAFRRFCDSNASCLVNEQKLWRMTHCFSLRDRDVLPLGYPLGVCSVRYDSISGRILIGDNYKMQAVYI